MNATVTCVNPDLRPQRTLAAPAPGLVLVLAMSAAALPAWANDTYTIGPELWDRPRSGNVVIEQPVVRQAVNAHLARAGSSLVIHHAAGQEPLLQAEELRAWLIALAVESGRVNLSRDLKPGEPLKIEVLR